MFGRKYYFKSDCTNDKVITDETNLIKEDEIDDVAKVSNNSINTHIDKYLRLNDFEYKKLIGENFECFEDKYMIPIRKDPRKLRIETTKDKRYYMTIDGIRATNDTSIDIANEYYNAVVYNYIAENCVGKITADIITDYYSKNYNYSIICEFNLSIRDFIITVCYNKKYAVVTGVLKAFDIRKLLNIDMDIDEIKSIVIDFSKFVDDIVTVTYKKHTLYRYYKTVPDFIWNKYNNPEW